MDSTKNLAREIKALVFDQYGTIVDMQKGLSEAAAPFLKKKGWDGEPHRFVTWWRRTHFENSKIDQAVCSSPTTPSIVSAPNLSECARPSLTGENAPLERRPTKRI